MRPYGQTLLGLLLTLAIASLLMLLAAPSFSGLVDRTRLELSTERLFSALWSARSEAVSRSETVVLAAMDRDWESGWRMFVDRNRDGLWQSSEPTVAEMPALPAEHRLSANGGIGPAVHYHPDGRTLKPGGGLQMGSFRFCTRDASRVIVINSVGRPRLEPLQREGC